MPRKTVYKSAEHGRFVTKKFAEQNPETTIRQTVCNLEEELNRFGNWMNVNRVFGKTIEDHVNDYLNETK